MTLGAEPKKLAVLGVLLAVAVYVLFFSGDEEPVTAPAPTATAPASVQPALPAPPTRGTTAVERTRTTGRVGGSEFRPTLRPRRPEERLDPTKIDPTLRLDLLAKLREVKPIGGGRNLFEFGTAPPKPTEGPKQQIATTLRIYPQPIGPQTKPPDPVPPPPPPPPAIPLKFYGYSAAARQSGGPRQAFFIEGDEVHIVREGDLIKRRYRVVRIGLNSVVVEDTQFKNQQTLPLEEQAG